MERSNIFTFDYELFLGEKSGTVNDCIIHPTKKLLEILKRYNVNGVFFIDTIYLIRLKEISKINNNAKIDYDNICNQLKELSNSNQYIFPHLHPHWLDASYQQQTNTWSLTNTSKYRVEVLEDEIIDQLFNDSINLLATITGTNKNEIDGYRAGGWSIQPFIKFKQPFIKHNIQYEFSAIPGKSISSDTLVYNFETAPTKNKYHFEDDICTEVEKGAFIQIPISAYSLNKLFIKLGAYYNMLKNKIFKIQYKGSTVKTILYNSKDIYETKSLKRFVAQFEQLNFLKFIAMLFLYKKSNFLHTVSHPKLMTNWDLFYLKTFLFIDKLTGKANTDFRKI